MEGRVEDTIGVEGTIGYHIGHRARDRGYRIGVKNGGYHGDTKGYHIGPTV